MYTKIKEAIREYSTSTLVIHLCKYMKFYMCIPPFFKKVKI